ncbi:uncharacterized protein LOC132565226 [Ylistrum balloti]|uniref:uncharacterized protein LOC132565226 n=1 Tax=Ylistrum balloti TaxID=509963 RepID=UPI002905BB91|nr:uncharacterized protein LOC132565226 [Ylistrum balloti]
MESILNSTEQYTLATEEPDSDKRNNAPYVIPLVIIVVAVTILTICVFIWRHLIKNINYREARQPLSESQRLDSLITYSNGNTEAENEVFCNPCLDTDDDIEGQRRSCDFSDSFNEVGNNNFHLSKISDLGCLRKNPPKPVHDTEHPGPQLKRNKLASIENGDIPSTDILNGQLRIRTKISLKNLKVPIERSDVKLIFSEGNFKQRPDSSFPLCGSIHTDLEQLSKYLDIENGRMLVSPVPEFYIGKHVILSDYAMIEIPLCISVRSNTLKVHWIDTKDITNPQKMRNVPLEKNALNANLEVFYVIPEDRNNCIRVYTRHFSLFYCTACMEEIPFKLAAEIYAREGSLDGLPTVHVKMPLLGPYEMLLDCREERNRSMEEIKFRRIDRGKINVFGNGQGTGLKFRLKPPEHWGHVTDNDQNVIYEKEQLIDDTPAIDCMKNRHLLQDDGDIQWKIKCGKMFRGKVALTICVVNFLRCNHYQDKESRFNPELNIEGDFPSAELWGSPDEHPTSQKELLRRLVSGLRRRATKEKLLEKLGNSRTLSVDDNLELLETLSDIQQKDHKSFLTNVRMALAEMDVPCNEDISYFLLNIYKVGTSVSSHGHVSNRNHFFRDTHDTNDQDETTPKSIIQEETMISEREGPSGQSAGSGVYWLLPSDESASVHGMVNGNTLTSGSGIYTD